MGAMVRRAKSILGNTDFTALFDKGYHTGSELEIARGFRGFKNPWLPFLPRPPMHRTPDIMFNILCTMRKKIITSVLRIIF
nr:hypothetical protein [Gillisia limnaea]